MSQPVQKAIKRYGIHALARRLRVDAAYVSRVANGKQPPSDRMLRVLGFERRVVVTFPRVPPSDAAGGGSAPPVRDD